MNERNTIAENVPPDTRVPGIVLGVIAENSNPVTSDITWSLVNPRYSNICD